MSLRANAAACVAVTLAACAAPAPAPTGESALASVLEKVHATPVEIEPDGAAAFRRFREAVADRLSESGRRALAADLTSLEPGTRPAGSSRRPAGRLLRRYLLDRYGEAIVADLREMIRFPTHAVEGRENWDAPEFARQRVWLEGRAGRLGLEFRSFDGRVEEIDLPGGDRVLGVLTHGDVQDVAGQSWDHPPWAGERTDDRVYGRGAEDDKGAIVTTMYVFAALRDTGWPVGATLRLIVANGEESSWEGVPYYLERRRPPDVTLGLDASYPVTHAQKAWAVLDLSAPEDEAAPSGPGWSVLAIDGGSGLSIIPERGAALLRPPPGTGEPLELLTERARGWAAEHPPARLQVLEDPQGLRVVAEGRGGHSSEQESGHNALGDLTAFLAGLDLAPTALDRLVAFVGTRVGLETDGAALGIAHRDAVMGALTVNLALFDEEDGVPRARLNLRVPRGIAAAEIEARVARVVSAFEADGGGRLGSELYMPMPPHYVPPDGPLVRRLLDVWREVTGEPGEPLAIGGGTQARLFPQGVDFGPAMPGQPYRGHGPDEYVTVEELQRNAQLTLGALWSLAAD